MASIQLTTWKDVLDHLLDWLGANPSAEALRDCRRASLAAQREVTTSNNWVYYYTRGRMVTVAPQNVGTAQYTNSTRTVTLTGATWPSWALYGCVVLNNITYQVASVTDSTDLVLSVNSNPGADIPAGATYAIYRDTYPLPVDCRSIDCFKLVNLIWMLDYEHPSMWLQRQQIYRGQATPRLYTMRGDPHYQGTMAASFFPAPDNIYTLDYIYQRRPRQLIFDNVSAGTVSVTSLSTSVTGVGTNWDSRLVGSIFRTSQDGINLPTNYAGTNPARYERVVAAVNSTTSLTLDASVDTSYSGVKYLISDPLDIEDGAMLTAVLRCAEWQLAQSRSKKDRELAMQEWNRALILAREADSRNFAESAAGTRRNYPFRLAYFPSGPDVS